MRNIGLIALREYSERIRGTAFVASTALVVLIMVAIPLVSMFFAGARFIDPVAVAVLDETGRIIEPLRQRLEQTRGDDLPGDMELVAVDLSLPELAAAVRDGRYGAYLYLAGSFPDQVTAQLASPSQMTLARLSRVADALDALTHEAKLADLGLPTGVLADLRRGADIRMQQLGNESSEARQAGFVLGVSYFAVLLIYTGILMYGTYVLQGVLEEKVSRVMEVMAGAVHPFHLMAGKILGLGALGLTQFAVWGGVWLTLGLGGAAMMPASGVSFAVVGYTGLFFMLGFFLYAALFAGAGSLVSRMEDAGTVTGPVTLIVVAAMLVSMLAVNNPYSSAVTVLSLIPFFTPTVMLARVLAVAVPTWQIVLSIALLVLGVAVVTWLASRIYRFGILTYGARPTLGQIWRFLRG